jgi:glycosyltransferase involved in cell wall biosynthesis
LNLQRSQTLPRVLVVSERLDIGGTETHLARVLPLLRQRGLDVSIFVLERGGALEAALVGAGVPVLGPDAGRSLLRAGLLLRQSLDRLRPDVVHYFLPRPYLVGSLATAGSPPAIRIMSRRSLSDYQRKHPVLGWVERRLHRATRALLANSTAVADELAAESGDRRKVGVIHNGIEIPPAVSPEKQQGLRRELGIPTDAFALAVIANLAVYKGHADLLAALAGIAGRLERCWRLILIGRDMGAATALRRQALSLGIDDNMLWLNVRPNAADLLDAADVAVLPSHQEGFSNSLLEKMARGLAVIATRVGGNLDAIDDGVSGILVPPGDPAALGAAILRLHADRELRARLGAAARQRVEQHFSLAACVTRYLNLYGGVRAAGDIPIQSIIEPAAAAVDASP